MRSGKIKSRLIRIPILILFISLALVMLIPIVWILLEHLSRIMKLYLTHPRSFRMNFR